MRPGPIPPVPIPNLDKCEVCQGTVSLGQVKYFNPNPTPTPEILVMIRRLSTHRLMSELAPGYNLPWTNTPDPQAGVVFHVMLVPDTRAERRRFMELNLLPYNSRDSHFYLELDFGGVPGVPPPAGVLPRDLVHRPTDTHVAGWERVVHDLIPGQYPALPDPDGVGGARPITAPEEGRIFRICRKQPHAVNGNRMMRLRRHPDPGGRARNSMDKCLGPEFPHTQHNVGVINLNAPDHRPSEAQLLMRYSAGLDRPLSQPTHWVPVIVALRQPPTAVVPNGDLRWGVMVMGDINRANHFWNWNHWYDLQVTPMQLNFPMFDICTIEAAPGTGVITGLYAEAGNTGAGKTDAMYHIEGWREILQELTTDVNGQPAPPWSYNLRASPWNPALYLQVRRVFSRTLEFADMRWDRGTFCGSFPGPGQEKSRVSFVSAL